MSAVTNMWRQLVQRRLWPVAILLVAALVAVPLTLAKEPDAEPVPPAPQVDTSEVATTPIVAAASADYPVKRRKVLGTAKNPFAVPKPAKASAAADRAKGPVVHKTRSSKTSTESDSTSGGSPSSGGGTTTTPGPAAPAPATPAEPAPKPKTYAPQELTVRFGTDDRQRQSLKRLQALPSEEEPVLIYMGIVGDRKTAEFLVGDGVVPVGDGECRPSPEECETIRLRAGETEFFDITDDSGNVVEQFQLDLVKIHRAGGASASKAKASVKAARLLQGEAVLRTTVGQTTARLP